MPSSSPDILVPDSSHASDSAPSSMHILVRDWSSVFVPASFEDTPSSPPLETPPQEPIDILVPGSSQFSAPETEYGHVPERPTYPRNLAPGREHVLVRDSGVAKRRPVMLKTIHELSDSFMKRLAKSAEVYKPRAMTAAYS